jgi:hypothetical protein
MDNLRQSTAHGSRNARHETKFTEAESAIFFSLQSAATFFWAAARLDRKLSDCYHAVSHA